MLEDMRALPRSAGCRAFVRDNRSYAHGGDRLHRRAPPLGVPRRAAGRATSATDWQVLVRHRGLATARRCPKRDERRRSSRCGTVLFPGGALPLRIFEQRYMEMAKACLRDSAPFGVCLIREGREVGAPAVPERVGCLARIADWDMPQLGLLQVTARGESASASSSSACRPTAWCARRVELLAEDERRAGARELRALRASCSSACIEQQPALLEPSASARFARVGERAPRRDAAAAARREAAAARAGRRTRAPRDAGRVLRMQPNKL